MKISVREAARMLEVSEKTVYRWIEQKGLPAHKVGKLWKFKKSEVDHWVRSGGAGESPSSSRIAHARARKAAPSPPEQK